MKNTAIALVFLFQTLLCLSQAKGRLGQSDIPSSNSNTSEAAFDKHYLDSLDKLLPTLSDSQLLVVGQEYVSYCNKHAKTDLAAAALLNLIDACKRLNDSESEANFLFQLGHTQKSLGAPNKALDNFFEALTIQERRADLNGIARTLIQIANIKKAQNLLDESLQLYQRALAIADQLNDDALKAVIYNNLGSAFKMKKSYAQAKEHFLRAIEINKELGNDRFLSYNYNNLANIFEETGDLESALNYHDKSIEIKIEIGDRASLANSYSNVSLCYEKQGKIEKALDYSLMALELGEEYNSVELMPIVYEQHARLQAAQKNFNAAYTWMQKLNRFNDSIDRIDSRTLMNDFEVRYERHMMEMENEQLKEGIRSSEAEIFRKNSFLIAFAISLILMATALVMYFISYRQRTEANRKLMEQNRAILFQKERIEKQKQKIEESTMHLERIRKDKEVFFSTISHDMRGPLSAIASIVTLLKEQNKKPSEEIQVLDFSAQTLSALIEDILDFANLETNRLRIEASPVSLAEVIREVATSFHFISHEKQVDLITEIDDRNIWVMSDAKRLRQVMFNLLGNALKFTKEGFVKVTLEYGNLNDDIIQCMISVQDTGIGIPEDKLDIIFKRFAQASDEIYKSFGGSGLGLFISKFIIEKMGGEIVVESKIGEGTIFTIMVPLKRAMPTEA